MKRFYNGKNNGSISFSERQAANAVGVTRQTISKAFERLSDRLFIKVTSKGAFSRKHNPDGFHRATTWELTEYPLGDSAIAGNDFKQWKQASSELKKNSRAQKSSPQGLKTSPCNSRKGVKITPSGDENHAHSETFDSSKGLKTSPHIDIPYTPALQAATASGQSKGQAKQVADANGLGFANVHSALPEAFKTKLNDEAIQ